MIYSLTTTLAGLPTTRLNTRSAIYFSVMTNRS